MWKIKYKRALKKSNSQKKLKANKNKHKSRIAKLQKLILINIKPSV